MNTYTAFVIDTDFGCCQATTWIETVQANGLEHGREIAEQACATSWGCQPNEVTCIGLAQGDINLVYWNDEAKSAHDKTTQT